MPSTTGEPWTLIQPKVNLRVTFVHNLCMTLWIVELALKWRVLMANGHAAFGSVTLLPPSRGPSPSPVRATPVTTSGPGRRTAA